MTCTVRIGWQKKPESDVGSSVSGTSLVTRIKKGPLEVNVVYLE